MHNLSEFGPQNWQVFNSPEEYGDFFRGMSDTITQRYISTHNLRFQGKTLDQSLECLKVGDTTNLAAAQKIIDQIGQQEIFTISTPMLRADVQGIIPNVPGLLAGHPQGMFARHIEEMPALNAPLSVYVDADLSAAVGVRQAVNRGVAVLAFVLAMEQIRPVDLYMVSIGSHSIRKGLYGGVIKIASRPMDLPRAVYMLTDPSFPRCLGLLLYDHMSNTNQNCNTGPWAFNGPHNNNFEPLMRQLIGMAPEDIFLKGGHITDTLMLTDPVQWVKNMIAQHGGTKDE